MIPQRATPASVQQVEAQTKAVRRAMGTFTSQSQSYRRGYVEGQSAGERDAYLLQAGCINLEEYERGFADGLASVSNHPLDGEQPGGTRE
jgi:hypothetical protein